MTIRMPDAAESPALPAGYAAYASYVDGGIGDQPNYARVTAAHPGADHLSIALSALHDAECLDVENGAASPSDVPAWVKRQQARGIARPVLYASVSTMASAILPILGQYRIPVRSTRLWSAHYGAGEHVCGPATCKWPGLGITMDGTQWTDAFHGPNGVVDMSLLADDFFGTTPARSITSEVPVQLPTVQQGDKGDHVRTVQALCNARIPGKNLAIDGDFGPATSGTVKAIQAHAKLATDGVVGPRTWPVLLGVG